MVYSPCYFEFICRFKLTCQTYLKIFRPLLGEISMSNPKKYVLETLLLMMALITEVSAQAPRLINYQGLVATSTGVPVSDGTHTFDFRIFNAATGGSQLWSETGISVV